MSDVELNSTNEGENGTEIQAQSNFGNNDFVFQADARTAGGGRTIRGLVGLGLNAATGVEGQSQSGPGVRGVGGGAGPRGGEGVLGLGGARGGSGVRGRGGSPALTPLDPSEAGIAGTGVSGRGGRLRAPQDSRDPAPGTRIAGPGVVGLGSTAKDPPLRDTAACGVFGVGAPAIDSRDHKVGGTGVFGQAGEKSTGETNNGAGVIGVSGTLNYSELEAAEKGVLGVSTNGTGVARKWRNHWSPRR